MLDYFGIFTKGGALLWTLQFTALKHNPVDAVNALIRACLLEERSGEKTFVFHPRGGAAQALKWTFDNGLGLVFVAVYQQTLSLLYVDELLLRIKTEFVKEYKPSLYAYPEFEDTFRKVLKDCENRADEKRLAATRSTPPMTQGGRKSGGSRTKVKSGGDGDDDDEGDDEAGADGKDSPPNGLTNGNGLQHGNDEAQSDEEQQDGNDKGNDGEGAFDVSKLTKKGPGGRQLPNKARSIRGRTSRDNLMTKAKEPKDDKDEKPKKGKVMRTWGVGGEEKVLDHSNRDEATNESGSGYESVAEAVDLTPVSMVDEPEDESYSDTDENEGPTGGNQVEAPDAAPKKKGLLSSFISNIAMGVAGKASLTKEDVAPALVEMKRKLMERNVAEEIAQQVCDSVASNLEGQKLTSFTGVTAFVRNAVEGALSGILNKRTIDVLLDIQKSKAKGRPYVMVFCGVNGVGKSTNLAKITYWLLQHGVRPMIAACDTFRAGAVEQLKTHCQRLKVPLYERGYEKDPAKVAMEAIRQAQRDGRDVVLVDTAGRMQDNEPLMRALSSLIHVNEPNLVLFVGEALVGNDAVDQLVKFNRALADLAPSGTGRRLIDGIVLTKFDTIDDKVGAALSMVYTSGAPIMFVGCGQTYVDLKKLNVKSVVKSLLK